MEFVKKQTVGFYLYVIGIILSVISIVMYLGNCKTAYFSNLGVSSVVTTCLIIAAICEVVFLAGNEVVGSKLVVLDILPVITAILLMVGTITFVSARVNGLAAIMTFTNNASTVADMNNTITSFVFCFGAILVNIVASFFKVVKE